MRVPSDRTHRILTADGTSLAVREIGSRTAPVTVIFAHGFCLHMDAWAPQRAYLAEVWRGRARLVFFDHRGHGGSGTADTDSYTISQLGRDLDVVIRTVAPKGPIVLVGHSMGGMA
ncbi:MAG: alpha/beta fold hydrolase, partial [Comamonadaceae bacterium]